MNTDLSRVRTLPPLDYTTARRLAASAIAGDHTAVVGPRVLASLLHQIELVAAERDQWMTTAHEQLRTVDAYEARELEAARLQAQAHAMAPRRPVGWFG